MSLKMNSLSQSITELSEFYKFKSDYGNELFLNILVPKLERCYLNGEDFMPNGKHGFLRDLIVGFVFGLAFILIFSFFTFLTTLLLLVYLIVFRKRRRFKESQKISVIRTRAAWSKIRTQDRFNKFMFVFDDMSIREDGAAGLYEIKWNSRLRCLIKFPQVFVCDHVFLFQDIRKLDSNVDKFIALKWFVLRVPQKLIFELYLERILRDNKCSKYLSGNKEDRFAILEQRICKKMEYQNNLYTSWIRIWL